MNLVNSIKESAQVWATHAIKWRHHLHANPELSFEEFETAQFVANILDQLDIPYQKDVAKTGLIATIRGRNPESKTLALRADMDALPIQEQNNVHYKSQKEGIMHACGHDVHTASLLGAAAILKAHQYAFEGTIRLIFQPGEERLPGGASLMIAAGALNNPEPIAILGQHVMPFLPIGTVGIKAGRYMASADEITMVVTGKGGHAAMPHQNIDPVLITAHIIVALQQIVSRHANPLTPSVLSFGKVTANGAFNIIPNQVEVLGTFRTMDEIWRNKAHVNMKLMAESMAESMGATCNFYINKGYPVLHNHDGLTELTKKHMQEFLGSNQVIDLSEWMAAEDFAYYSQKIPACFYRLGTRNEQKGITSAVHTPTFDIDEDAMPISIGLMAYLAINNINELK